MEDQRQPEGREDRDAVGEFVRRRYARPSELRDRETGEEREDREEDPVRRHVEARYGRKGDR